MTLERLESYLTKMRLGEHIYFEKRGEDPELGFISEM
jgi:hypothetical protein